MATNFPTSLDSFSNPSGSEITNSPTPALKHSTQHANINDAVAALEAKVGVNNSTVTTSLDYRTRAQTTLFTTGGAGNYTIPTGATAIQFTAIGSGGPGGAGRRGAAGTIRCGGGGGGGGGRVEVTFPVSFLTTMYPTGVLPYQVGIPPSPFAGATTDDTNGNGASSTVATTGATWVGTNGDVLMARGGTPGSGGTASAGTGGAAGVGMLAGGTGASASTSGSTGISGGQGINGIQGGGSGGGITSANVANNGGAGLSSLLGRNAGSGSGGVVDSTLPGRGTSFGPVGAFQPGPGGGAASITAAAQAGADALENSGNGGGGGGASLNGFASGAGGAGSVGWLRITAYF